MVSIQEFEKALEKFKQEKVESFPSLKAGEESRGKSFIIKIEKEFIRFKRKNSEKRLKIAKFREVIELLLKKKRLLTTDIEYIKIISDGCVRTFIFQFLVHYQLAEVHGRPYCAEV